MASQWVSDAEFWRRHAANRRTARYRDARKAAILRDPRCAVCGTAYLKKYSKWQLRRDHKRYRDASGNLIFGRESEADFRLVCPGCDRKGARGDSQIRDARSTRRFMDAVDAAFEWPWRALRWLLRRLLK
jgi:hypothetical protein